MAETLAIEPKKQGKGRSFSVSLLGFLTADRFWDGGSRTAYRPIFVNFAETDQMARAFTANLRTGRPAIVRDRHSNGLSKHLEVPRAAGMKWFPRRLPTGITIMTGYLPSLSDLDPGLMPDRITFLFAPPSWWVEQQLQHPKIQALPPAVRRETVLGGWFCAFADKRTPFPVVPDPLFHRRLYLAAKGRPWFHSPSGTPYTPGPFFAYPETTPPGLETVAVVDVSHQEFEELLRVETARYFREETPDWLYAPEPEHGADVVIDIEAETLPAVAAPEPAAVPIAWVDRDPEHDENPMEAEPIEVPAVALQPVEEEEPDLGETRIPGAGGVLPHPSKPTAQLSLFDLL